MQSSDTQPIKVSLRRLMTAMTNLGLEPPSHLQPGLTRQEIIDAFAELGLTPSEDMIGFYEFANGVLRDEMRPHQITLFSGYSLLPLEEAIYEYTELLGKIREIEESEEHKELTSSQFPFLAWGNWYYLIDLDAERAGRPCILSYATEIGSETKFSSLGAMFDALAEAYERGEPTSESGYVPLNAGPEEDVYADNVEVVSYSSLVSPRYSRNLAGPQGAMYLVTYVNPRLGKALYEVSFTLPKTDRLPPIGYVDMRPEGINLTDAQIIEKALRDIQDHYGVALDISIEESLAWRKKMSEYTRTLAKTSG